jgi:hypothetical protein
MDHRAIHQGVGVLAMCHAPSANRGLGGISLYSDVYVPRASSLERRCQSGGVALFAAAFLTYLWGWISRGARGMERTQVLYEAHV